MRIRTVAAGALLLAALAGCSAGGNPAPEKASTAPAAASPSLSKVEATEQCIDAVAGQPADDESKPAECESLSDSEYLDANLKGVQQRNKAGREDLQRQIEEAQESATSGN